MPDEYAKDIIHTKKYGKSSKSIIVQKFSQDF